MHARQPRFWDDGGAHVIKHRYEWDVIARTYIHTYGSMRGVNPSPDHLSQPKSQNSDPFVLGEAKRCDCQCLSWTKKGAGVLMGHQGQRRDRERMERADPRNATVIHGDQMKCNVDTDVTHRSNPGS